MLLENGGVHFNRILELEASSVALEKDKSSHEEVKYFLRDLELKLVDPVEDLNQETDGHARTTDYDGFQELGEIRVNIEDLEDFAHIRNIANGHVGHHVTQLIDTYVPTQRDALIFEGGIIEANDIEEEAHIVDI